MSDANAWMRKFSALSGEISPQVEMSISAQDLRSRTIVEHMQRDEARHADQAQAAGAVELPPMVQRAMAATARIMTTLAYRL